ncbi:MAG: nickel pincer cofactor biosynthesis protein LarB [Chloroflexota bacterium]
MDIKKLRQMLDAVQQGETTIDEALEHLRQLPYEDLGYARLDLHRPLRNGMPEVVFCQGKTTEQIIAILKRLWQHHDRVLGTRLVPEMAEVILKEIPEAHYDPLSRLLTLVRGELPAQPEDAPYALIVTGGTSDMSVAEEAAQTLEFMGSRVERAYDVGVAGIHRLFDQLDLVTSAAVVISAAGMEGALTSVVGGLVSCPVIGVPTSVGYGASFNGLSALLAMLNSCATGVSVVNIDNGFGAGVVAYRILQAGKPSAPKKDAS